MSNNRSKIQQIENSVRAALTNQNVPNEILEALLVSMRNMLQNYLARQIRPSELNAGDFTEATIRVLQFLVNGKYTSLGKSLPSINVFLQQMEDSRLDDALRIHVPRLLQVIYDVRNRRGVGHLPGSVSSNKPDAELLMVSVRWILAQFVRLFHGVSNHDDAQRIVDILALHDSPVVEDFEGVKRIISQKTIALPRQILILLLSADSETLPMGHLFTWIKGKKTSVTISIKRLDERNLVHVFPDKRVALTSLGRKTAEEVISQVESS